MRDTLRGLALWVGLVSLVTLLGLVAVPLIVHDIAVIVEFWKQ